MQPKQNHLRILKEIAELVNEETAIESLLSGVLKKLLQLTGFSTGWFFLIDEKGRHQLAAFENLPPALSENGCQSMKKGGCWCVDRFRNGRLNKATNIISCKRIEDVLEEKRKETNGILYHATVPLISGKERFGLLNVASPYKKEFTDDELALLESVAFQIGSAIKRIRLTENEKDVALMEERNRLARDLHDSVNQLLFSLSLTARGGMEQTDSPELKETFSTIQQLAQEALTEMRALIWQLRPKGLEHGLVQAIQAYADVLGLSVQMNVKGVVKLPSKVEEVLWRISQEALNNCKKHAGVKDVTIHLYADQDEVSLTIADQGCGFYYSPTSDLPSVGIQSMRERAESIGGSFQLQTKPGQGTKVNVTIKY
jgi:two-component system, NarL family, sensor kinase